MVRNIIDEVLEYNTEQGDLGKLIEELAELSEVVIKKYLKQDPHKPPMEKLIEEMGDVLLRMCILSQRYGIDVALEERIDQKSAKLFQYMDEGKYKGGV